MSKRVRHPMVSLGMFLVLCGVAFAVWKFRNDLTYQSANVVLNHQVRDDIEEEIMSSLEEDDCFLGLRGHIKWRPNERRYRLDIEVEQGSGCESNARALSAKIAAIVKRRTDKPATVIAFDPAGREMGRTVL